MNLINDILWTYILIAMLLGCAIWFTIKTRFVQFRMIGEMLRLLKDSAGKGEHGEKHISSLSLCHITGKPCRYRKSGWRSYGNCHRRTGCHILDVDHCSIRSIECFCRIYPRTII